jgi:cytochrome P450
MATYNIGGLSLTQNFWGPLAKKVFVHLFVLLDRWPTLRRYVTFFFRFKPVWRLGRTVLVTGDRQVREVLRRDDDFALPEHRAGKFLCGAFVLGMTRTPQFELERDEIEKVIKRDDRERVEQLAGDQCQILIDAARPRGRLDVVADLCTPIGQLIIKDYFGIHVTSDGWLMDDLRLLGAMVASPKSEFDEFRQEAERAARRVFDHINHEIDAVEMDLQGQSELSTGATVLERLVFRWMKHESKLDREGVRRNMTGVLLPGSALVTRAFVTGLKQLLRRKELHDEAMKAVKNHDMTQLEGCILEALRFHPVFPIVPRYCPRSTELQGFKHRYGIAAGTGVYASAASAMFDPNSKLFDGSTGGHPPEARVRPREHYVHFGGGAHECPGQHIVLPQMAAMMFHLLSLRDLKAKKIRYHEQDGICPSSLEVRFRRENGSNS